ncbi:MAG: bifunctional phosphoglucose/phosphomannose isomerase [Actinomycetota bacterium]
MIDLDDPAAVAKADPGEMLAAVAALPEDCRKGYEAGRGVAGLPDAADVLSITLCGMGGSAVAGDMVRALYIDRLGLPIDVVRSPILPEAAGPHSLVVAASYSGNTAETLASFEEAVRRGCRLVSVTSGGELEKRSNEAGVPMVPIPPGMQPRAALGFLGLGTLGALESIGVVPSLGPEVDEAAGVLESLVAELGPDKPSNPAKELAKAIGERVPIIWGAEGIGSLAAMRWKTQMNENGKRPAFWSSMSELDHNELAGWGTDTGEPFFLIIVRHPGEDPSIAPRFPLSASLVAETAGLESREIQARGDSALSWLLSLIFFGDFTSVYSALLRGVDPTPVDVIERLKKSLAGA